MFKKIFVALSLSTFLTSLSFAEDLLAFYTNGKLTENSPGVKVLSLDEKKQVKGGYYVLDDMIKFEKNPYNRTSEAYIPVNFHPNEIPYVINYIYNANAPKGLCALDYISCPNPSAQRLRDYLDITNQAYDFSPVYIVKRQIQYSTSGNPFVVFSYGVGAMDTNGNFYKFNSTTSSRLLNYNIVMKEIANKYKDKIESAMGGYNTNRF